MTEYRNQNGDLVITATGVGVQTERAVIVKEINVLKESEIKIGDNTPHLS